MDPGDLIFYGIIAISVISSIVKAVKKKPEEVIDTGMPDYKGSPAGNIFKTILQELEEKDDEYIPSNPKPAPSMTSQVNKPKMEQLKRQERASAFNKTRTFTGEKPLRESLNSRTSVEAASVPGNLSNPILQNLDLQNMDELKKAIIYSEIIRPKF